MKSFCTFLLIIISHFQYGQTEKSCLVSDKISSGLCIDDAYDTNWFILRNEVYRLKGSVLKQFTEKDGLKVKQVYCLLEDTGGLWVGTDKGIYRFNGEQFTPYTITDSETRGCLYQSVFLNTPPESSCCAIYCMLRDKNGDVWFGGNNRLYHYNGKYMEGFSYQNDQWKIVSVNSLIYSYVEKSIQPDSAPYCIRKLFENKDGQICFIASRSASQTGYIWLDRESFHLYTYDGIAFTPQE